METLDKTRGDENNHSSTDLMGVNTHWKEPSTMNVEDDVHSIIIIIIG